MDSWSNFYDRPTTLEEQQLYDHWLTYVEVESPAETIRRFRQLFIDGTGYNEPQVWRALESMITVVDQDFRFILNRCCHILINRWLMHPRLHEAIPQLIALFETTPTGLARSRTTKRLRHLVQYFRTTEQYQALCRLSQVISQGVKEREQLHDAPLRALIHRYPCLYEHCLLTEDSAHDHRREVRAIKVNAQQKLELGLSQYIASNCRRSRPSTSLIQLPSDPMGIAWMEQRSARNPTLLSDRQLDAALHHFTGKIDGSNTYRDLAQQFRTYSSQTRSYRTFKGELYEYLTSSIDSKYGNHQFNARLSNLLQDMLVQSDSQKVNDMLMVSTCRKLLNFLVVESPQRLFHSVYIDLTSNLGISTTIGLLLKILLLCRKVMPYLEKRFSILFNHYEACSAEAIDWLVGSLEHFNIALATNFGSVRV